MSLGLRQIGWLPRAEQSWGQKTTLSVHNADVDRPRRANASQRSGRACCSAFHSLSLRSLARGDLERDRYADAAIDSMGLHQSVERASDAILYGVRLPADAD